MATPKNNEKRLDYAQKIIEQVIKDCSRSVTDYRSEDLRNLHEAWAKLTTVTLVKEYED